MKNNTLQTRNLLEQALRSLPGDFALQGVRSHIAAALGQVNAVERRRQARHDAETKVAEAEAARLSRYRPWLLTPQQAGDAIASLDKMIQHELGKIAEARDNRNKRGPGNDARTILG